MPERALYRSSSVGGALQTLLDIGNGRRLGTWTSKALPVPPCQDMWAHWRMSHNLHLPARTHRPVEPGLEATFRAYREQQLKKCERVLPSVCDVVHGQHCRTSCPRKGIWKGSRPTRSSAFWLMISDRQLFLVIHYVKLALNTSDPASRFRQFNRDGRCRTWILSPCYRPSCSGFISSLLADLRTSNSGTPRGMGRLRGVVEDAQPVCQLDGFRTNLQKVNKSESAWGTLQ